MNRLRRKIRKEQAKLAKRSSSERGRIHFNPGWFWLVFSLLLAIYTIYLAVLITGVEKEDPLSENGSSSYLLSSTSFDSLDKTLWIFESGDESDARIDSAFLIAKNEEKGILLNIFIPGWLYFDSSEENIGSSISVSNFRYAGDFLEEGRGIEYAIWQFEQMLGTKVNQYIWIESEEQTLYSEIFGSYTETQEDFGYDNEKSIFTQNALFLDSFLKRFSIFDIVINPVKISNFGEGIISSIGFADILKTFFETKNDLNRNEKYILDLGTGEYISEELSDTGGVVYFFDSSVYDTSFRSYLSEMIDRELEKEQVRVEVYNGSGISGVAGQIARKIENSGCDVVRYENSPDTAEETVLYIPKEEGYENSIEVVKEVIGSSVEIINERPNFMTTGDIVVVLGEDIEKMYSF